MQVNALRYQSVLIISLQRAWLYIDLLALVLFFYRNPLKGPQQSGRAGICRWAGLLWLPTAIVIFNQLYMNIVPSEADVYLVRYGWRPPEVNYESCDQRQLEQADRLPLWERLRGFLKSFQLFDLLTCPRLGWGCRYLRVEHRTLVDRVWDDKAMVDLRVGGPERARDLAAIEGLVLRNRSLRFAVLEDSSLFVADLSGADLRKATLKDASLSRALLVGAKLQGADLHWAGLDGADLGEAQLQGAELFGAQLKGADLRDAQLQGADLSMAQLQAADLRKAKLLGACAMKAGSQGVDLRNAQLQGADLRNARLQGAIFSESPTQSGGDKDGATNLELSDLRDADFTTALESKDQQFLHAAIAALPEGARKRRANERIAKLLTSDYTAPPIEFKARLDRQVLVSDPGAPIFKNIDENWLIPSPTQSDTYISALVGLLADDLARGDFAVAEGIARRALHGFNSGGTGNDSSLYASIACRLIANVRAARVKLSREAVNNLFSQLQQLNGCEPAKAAAR